MSKKFTVTLEDEEHRVLNGLCKRDNLSQKRLLLKAIKAYQEASGKLTVVGLNDLSPTTRQNGAA